MIAIRKQNGAYSPVVICDECGEVISDAFGAMQVSSPAPEGTTAQAFHVHKGACDQALSARLDGIDGSEELSVHLLQLIRSTMGSGSREQIRNLLDWSDHET